MKTLLSRQTWKRIIARGLTLVLLGALSAPASAVDFVLQGAQGGADSIFAGIGDDVSIDLVIVNDDATAEGAIQGFQASVSYDDAALELKSVMWEDTALDTVLLNGKMGPSFYLLDEAPAGGVGFTLGVIFQDDSLSFTLGEGEHIVSRVVFGGLAETAEPSPVEFTALGDPLIENKFTNREGDTEAPASLSGVNVSVADTVYSIHFAEEALLVSTSSDVRVPIILENSPSPVTGFSFGVTHDASSLTLSAVEAAEGLTSVIGELGEDPPLSEDSPFYALNTSPDGGDGFTLALILSSSDASAVLDPAQSPHHIFDAVYTTGEVDAVGEVSVTGDLGSPAVAVALSAFGLSQDLVAPVPAPATTVTITISSGGIQGQPFLRGDVDQNGSLNITDAIAVLRFLFSGVGAIGNELVRETIESCPVVLNADGSTDAQGVESESNVNLTDVIRLLDFLFQNGPRPAQPFPDCGQPENEVAEAFRCVKTNCK